MYNKTIAFDFDGVIHSYTSGWQGATVIPDPIVPGIDLVIRDLRSSGYTVAVISARCDSETAHDAIQNYLEANGIEVDLITSIKIPALCYIDDRAICFKGCADNLIEQIKNFEPWHRERESNIYLLYR